MSIGHIRGESDLVELAREIRERHDDGLGGSFLDSGPGIVEPTDGGCYVHGAEGELYVRKRAAAKLTAPLEQDEDYLDFTPEDWLEVYRQTWKIRMGSVDAGPEDPKERAEQSRQQYLKTVDFAQKCWKMGPHAVRDDDWWDEEYELALKEAQGAGEADDDDDDDPILKEDLAASGKIDWSSAPAGWFGEDPIF